MTDRSSRWPAPAIALLAARVVDRRHRQSVHLRRSLHHRAEPGDARPRMRWWRVFVSSYWPRDWGGDGYRPLTILAFKIEYAHRARQPDRLPCREHRCSTRSRRSSCSRSRAGCLPLWAAWVTAALFAVHPVHVEAVANVVGQSELLVAVALLAATSLYLRDRLRGSAPARDGSSDRSCSTPSACFAKEHGIVLPAILAAAELTVIRDATPWRERIRALRPFYLDARAHRRRSSSAFGHCVLADHSIGGFQPFTPFSTLHISHARSRSHGARRRAASGCGCSTGPRTCRRSTDRRRSRSRRAGALRQLPGLARCSRPCSRSRVLLRRRQPVISFGIAFVVHRAAAVEQLPAAGRHRARRTHAVSAERRRDARSWARSPWSLRDWLRAPLRRAARRRSARSGA